jgi:hypothetical protein
MLGRVLLVCGEWKQGCHRKQAPRGRQVRNREADSSRLAVERGVCLPLQGSCVWDAAWTAPLRKLLIEKDRPVDITRFTNHTTSSSVHRASLHIMPSRGVKGGVVRKKERSFGDLVAGFETCAEHKDQHSPPSSKKRRGGFDM